jgi:hypothetical protein
MDIGSILALHASFGPNTPIRFKHSYQDERGYLYGPPLRLDDRGGIYRGGKDLPSTISRDLALIGC